MTNYNHLKYFIWNNYYASELTTSLFVILAIIIPKVNKYKHGLFWTKFVVDFLKIIIAAPITIAIGMQGDRTLVPCKKIEKEENVMVIMWFKKNSKEIVSNKKETKSKTKNLNNITKNNLQQQWNHFYRHRQRKSLWNNWKTD